MSAIFTFIGCMAKESTLVVPLISPLFLLLYPPSKKLYKHILGGIILQILACFAYIFLRSIILGTIGWPQVDSYIKERSFWNLYFNGFHILGLYFKLSIYPFSLSCDYPLRALSFHISGVILPVIAVIFLFGGIWGIKKGKKDLCLLCFSFFWFVFALSPVLHVISIQIPFAERLLLPAFPGIIFFCLCS